MVEAFAELHPLLGVQISSVFVQNLADIGKMILGRRTRPVSDPPNARARALFVAMFDSARATDHIRHLIPPGVETHSLDEIRLPESMLTNRRRYLDPLNFATNFAFFRDDDQRHTRIVTANYWAGYGARDVRLWLTLFDHEGRTLAEWEQQVPVGPAGVVIDSREIRRRFALGPFEGQLSLHVVGAAGHDVVKYALDVFGESPGELSCMHDANAWPADLYAGLPAPREDERVILWIQNSHPCPIPRGAVGLNVMGSDEVAWLQHEVPAFGSYPLDLSALLPRAGWPQQVEIRAGKHFVRPRYEVIRRDGRRRIAHPNVERTDLTPDPQIAHLAQLMGKGYLLAAPVLPIERFRSVVLPTPMATTQIDLPVALRVYDASGRETMMCPLGRLPRDHAIAIDVGELLAAGATHVLPSGYGHMELVYDFRDGGRADGWLHALFRYSDKNSRHTAETSFGAHIFNTVLTYRGEPQSYSGPPPGLSTRLFLHLGDDGRDTFCHLIYPASTPWRQYSSTALILNDRTGTEIAREIVRIPCSGSLLWWPHEIFGRDRLARASGGGYVLVRDTTCRLFGYQGLSERDQAFSLDHMFGF